MVTTGKFKLIKICPRWWHSFSSAIIGVVSLQKILSALISKSVKDSDTIENLIARVYPKLYSDAKLGLLATLLEKEPYVIILKKDG